MSGTNRGQPSNASQQHETGTIHPSSERALRDLNVGPISQLVLFSIRNGTVDQARSLVVRPTISAAWHWRTIRNMDPMKSLDYVEAYIRMYYAQIMTQPATTNTVDQNRKLAIVLGVARAVSTARYKIREADLILEESAQPWLEYVVADDGSAKIVVMQTVPANVMAFLTANLNISDLERAAMAALHMSAIGLLPLQGYSLAMCGHHYLSDPATQSRMAYDVVEKTHWTGTGVSTWFSQDAEKIRDALWHKAGHPVNLTIKRQLSFDPDVPGMLVEAGAGAAASRLPAVEPELRAAKSYRTLCQTVRPLIEGYGGSLNYDTLDLAITTVQAYPAQDPTAVISGRNPPRAPDIVNSRQTALKWLQQVMEKNRDIVAFCFGFYTALSEQNAMLSGGGRTDTLKTSYSLRKLKTQSFASFVLGQHAYGDYTAHKAAERAAAT